MNDKLSEHILLKEAIFSATAQRLGIDNTPNATQMRNMAQTATNLFEPLRTGLGNRPIHISSFFRGEILNRAVGGAKNSQHCFDDKTEILTNNGWRDISSIEDSDKPITLNLTTNKLEQADILEVIKRKFDGKMYQGFSKHIDYCVTDEHRMLSAITSTPKKYNFEFAKDIVGKRRVFKVSGIVENSKSEHDIDLLKLCMVTIADGCVYKKKGCKSPFIRYVLKKERKKEALESLLGSLNIHFNKRHCINREKQGQFDVYEYTVESRVASPIVDIVGCDKKIPTWFLSLPYEYIKELLITYINCDGYIDPRDNCAGVSISSINKHNIDILQAMAISCGYRAVISLYDNISNSFNIGTSIYSLSMVPKITSRSNENQNSQIDYSGNVWCVRTKNETVISRRNGKVIITGNCTGEAMDLDTDGFPGAPTNLEIFNHIKDNLSYDQLINEFPDEHGNPQWIHCSYSSEENRKNILVSKKIDGRTIYENFI